MPDTYESPTVSDIDAHGNEVPLRQAAAEQQAAPPEFAEPIVLNVRFRDQHASDIQFKMKSTTSLGKAMEVFCNRVQRKKNSLRFLYEGVRVLDEHTPESLEMDGDSIVDVYEEQIGGILE